MSTYQTYWDRKSGKIIKTENYAGNALDWMYGSTLGRIALKLYFSTRLHSWAYKKYKQSCLSKNDAIKDIEKYAINMDEFLINKKNIRSYRDFFLRKFKENKRPFVSNPHIISSCAEGNYLGYKRTHSGILFPVKGNKISAKQILSNTSISQRFENGPVLICRLCPIDYHWFHFPVSGIVETSYRLHGKFHAVNLVALQHKSDVYCVNERHVSILKTEKLGRLAFVEVGAMGVGRIIQTYKGNNFICGQEKGYFDFGASTIIIFGEAGRWIPSNDILEQTQLGRETRIKLGDQITSSGNNYE